MPFLDAVAVLDEAQDTLTIFGVNRSLEDSLPLDADLRGFGRCRVVEHLVLEHAEPTTTNTAQHPHNVVPHSHGDASMADGHLTATLPRLSWNVIRLAR